MRKIIFTLFAALLLLTANSLKAAIVTVGATGTYPSIQQAVTGIGAITEPLIIELTADYARTKDTISAITGADATNTVTIRPQATLTVSGSADYVWRMDGCSYVTIDGRVNGEGAVVLTLRADTIVGNSLLTTPLLKKNSALYVTNAANNKVQYVNIKAATSESYWRGQPTTAPTMGSVTLASGTTNMTIDNCDLGPIDNKTGTPTVAIVSLGTVSAPNSGIVISNNKIYDYFAVDLNKCTTIPGTGVGVLIYDYNSNCTVSGNSFYNTYAHPTTMFANNNNARSVAVAISNVSGSGFIVKNNYIGGSAPECGGADYYTVDTRNNTAFNGIFMSASTSGVSAIYGNTIKNIMVLSHSAVAQLYQCSGITVYGGNVMVGIQEDGTTAAGNTIGDIAADKVGANASIKFCATNNNAAFSGIVYNSLASGNVKISNNKIAGVTVNLFKDYATIRTASFVGFNVLGTAASTMAFENNEIGNSGVDVTHTSMSIQNYMQRSNYGFLFNTALPAGSSVLINNNKVNNMYNAQQTTGQTYSQGIWVNTNIVTPVTITNNTIRDLVFTNGRTNDTPINWTNGIFCGSQGNGTNISGNTIYNITGLNASSANLTGISVQSTSSSAVVNIFNNNIYNLSSNITRKIGQYSTGCTGIFTHVTGAVTPTFNVYNNMIRLGYDRSGNAISTASLLIGIRDSLFSTAAVNGNYYNNTIYIGGSGVAASDSISSYGICLATSSATVIGTVRKLKNNLIVNSRSNATTGASHFAIATGGFSTALTNLTSDRNNFYVSGTGGVLGRFTSGAAAATLTDIQTYTAGDANSKTEVPYFSNATAATPNLHLIQNEIENGDLNFGEVLALTALDIDGDTRKESSYTVGADEYKGPQTAIENSLNKGVYAFKSGNSLMVNNLVEGQLINVYNANGQLVYNSKVSGNQIMLNLNKGIYLIKTENQNLKVVM